MPDPAERPLEFTAVGRAWCASSLPLMAVVATCLALALREPVLNLILAIALFAIPCGAALALVRCRRAAQLEPLTRWDVLWSFLTTGVVLGAAIPAVIVGVMVMIAAIFSLGSPPDFRLLGVVAMAAVVAMLVAAIGVIVALPLAWLAGWIASRTGFRPAPP